MESFTAFLEKRVTQVDSLLCIGLDPHRGDLTEFSAQAAGAFCTRLIEATADIAAAYKPNAAFFEALGPEGIVALQSVIAAVPDGIPVLLDAKRGDIASTAEAYADAVYRVLGADAVTLSPYLGRDSIEPFIADPKQGVFLLCKTSNPGASDLQDLEVIDSSGTAPQRLYEHIATLAQTWNAHHNLGLVVGATQVESLDNVRAAAPDLWFLTPGIGAQGGDLRAALRAGLRADGLGMLIPVSRAIARADDPRETALALRSQINMEREEIMASKESPGSASALTGDQSQLADALLDAGCIQFGNFTLRSGLESPIYIDLRRLASYPKLLSQAA
ncbi:MAG: orotidine-5'-phosphate decarboxylase, partial [Chloroflexota bacterium]